MDLDRIERKVRRAKAKGDALVGAARLYQAVKKKFPDNADEVITDALGLASEDGDARAWAVEQKKEQLEDTWSMYSPEPDEQAEKDALDGAIDEDPIAATLAGRIDALGLEEDDAEHLRLVFRMIDASAALVAEFRRLEAAVKGADPEESTEDLYDDFDNDAFAQVENVDSAAARARMLLAVPSAALVVRKALDKAWKAVEADGESQSDFDSAVLEMVGEE